MSSGGSKSATVGYKYYVGVHMALCHGPVDKLVRIRVGGKKAWVGEGVGGLIEVNKPELFGGERREGGISGKIDIEMGGPEQGQNSYLAGKLGAELLPAFRGLCCAVLRQCYMGLNPYLKDWGWLLQRIHTRQDGQTQWYDEKAEIGTYIVDEPSVDISLPYKDVFLVGSLWSYITVPQSDIGDYTGMTTSHGFGPIVDKLPHPYENPPFLNTSATATIVPLMTTLWAEIEIAVTDRRPVNVTLKCDNAVTVWIDGVLHETSNVSAFVAEFSFSPTKARHTMTVKVTEAGVDDEENFKYLDAYAYQSFVADRTPYLFGEYADMNPAHIVRECLTDPQWGLGYADEDIDDASFEGAADKLYAEQMGISILWAQQASLEDFIADILRHIDATLYVDRSTGKFKIKLIRADYVESNLLVLNKSNISKVENYTGQAISDLVSEVTVLYNSHEADGQDSVTLQNIALVQQQGIVPATVEYPGFTNQTIVSRVCARDLKALSTPLKSCTIYANRAAASLNPGDCFVWEWEEADDAGNRVETSYVMRISDISYGDGIENAVKIVCTQDVFDLPSIIYVEVPPTEWTLPGTDPAEATPRLVTEMPYYEIVRRLGDTEANSRLTTLPELGYVMVAAGRAAAEINAELQIDSGAGYVESGTLDFCPCAVLDGAIGLLDTTAALKDGVDLDEFAEGSLAQIDDEIIVIESITDSVATIRRGCLDTVPTIHADDSAVIIWDGSASTDSVEYVSSDEVDAKILTATGTGLLALASAPVDSVTMAQRANRPYPPANLQIAGVYFPDEIEASDLVGIVASWAHRDRTQQTGGAVLGWTAGSVGPEDGVTYSIRVVQANTGAELDSEVAISGNTATLTTAYRGLVRLELWSKRGDIESRSKILHEFDYVDPLIIPVAYVASTLSAIDKAAAITLSNGNRTATRATGSAWAVVKSANGLHLGKRYFEITNVANGSGTGDAMWGFHEAADSLSYYPGNVALTANSMGWEANLTPNSAKFQDGSLGAVTGYGTVAVGQYSRFAIDFDAGKLWVRNSAAAGWAGGGDPAAGTSPTFTFTPNAHLFVAVGAYAGPQAATVNFGNEAFLGTVPSGFASGWTAPEGPGSSLTFDSRLTASGTADAQGVAADGTHVWYSNSSTIFKYTKAGALVTSRVVSTDAPTDKLQINGMFYKDGTLYVSAAKYVGGVATSWIVQYNPDTLAYISHVQISSDKFSEGLAFKGGCWWVVFHATKVCCQYDPAWTLIATHALRYGVTGSSGGFGTGTGYDGVAWVDDYMLCNIHETYDQDCVDIYYWNGTEFEDVNRLARPTAISTQGMASDPAEPGVIWFAERNYSGTDAIVKSVLT